MASIQICMGLFHLTLIKVDLILQGFATDKASVWFKNLSHTHVNRDKVVLRTA